MYKHVLILSFIISLPFISFSQITPWANQTSHDKVPSILSISDNGRFILSTDTEGCMVIRDIETKKIVRLYKTNRYIEFAFFQKDSLNVIYIENDISGNNININKIDFIRNTDTRLKNYKNRGQKIKIDVSPNKEKIAILCSLELYEFNLEINKTTDVINNINEAYFDANNKLKHNKKCKSGYTSIVDSNNKSILKNKKNNNLFECIDHTKGKRVTLNFNDLDLEGTLFNYIVDFGFSPESNTLFLTFNNDNYQALKDGYVTHIFAIKNSTVLWSKEKTSLYKETNAIWVSDTELLFTNSPNNIILIENSEELVFQNNPNQVNDSEVFTSVEINSDLDKILYSFESGNTYLMDLNQGSKERKIINGYNRFLQFGSEESFLISKSHTLSGTCNDNLIKIANESGIDTISKVLPYSATNAFTFNAKTNSLLYSVSTNKLCDDLISNFQLDSLIYSSQNNTIGFTKDKTKYYDLNQTLNLTDTTTIVDLKGDHLIIQNFNQDLKQVFLNSSCNEMAIAYSYDFRYISYSCDGNPYQTINISGDPSYYVPTNALTFIHYSKTSPLTCGVDTNGVLRIWNNISQDTFFMTNVHIGTVQKAAFLEKKKILLVLVDDQLLSINYNRPNSELLPFTENRIRVQDFYLSENKSYISIKSKIENGTKSEISNYIYSTNPTQKLYETNFTKHTVGSTDGPIYKLASFHKEKNLCLTYNGKNELNLLNLSKNPTQIIATINLFENGEWLAYTPQGYFDASTKGRESLYYVVDDEVVLYSQIKERFWQPDLLKILLDDPSYFDGQQISKLKLYPRSRVKLTDNSGLVTVNLDSLSGGIGRVSLYINDKEVNPDINESRQDVITVSLEDYEEYLYPFGLNTIGIKTFNSEGWISSRINELYLDTESTSSKSPEETLKFLTTARKRRKPSSDLKPRLFGLFIGTSEYKKNSKLNLDFADKDAIAMENAFDKISNGLYSNTSLVKLTSKSKHTDSLSSKKNILNALSDIEMNATLDDVVILFLSGHGITIGNDFYYLTKDVGDISFANDSTYRSESCLSSKEILESLRRIKANKQILVLDACHSGKIAEFFTNKSKTLTTSQLKVLESLKDKMGTYILASSESNQLSYETIDLNQGLLTYSLLLGMSGEAVDEKRIDVLNLINYASRQTEELSLNLKKANHQRPVIGIGDGAGSFDIGIKNESLKPTIPSEYIMFGKPRFGILPSLNDPINFEEKLRVELKNQGVFGGANVFIYLDSEDKDTYNLSGTYELLQNNTYIKGKLYILKEDQVVGEVKPFEASIGDPTELDRLIKSLIDEAIKIIRPPKK